MDIERNSELRLTFFYLIIIITLFSLLACDKTDELITEKQKIIVESCDNGFEIKMGNYIIQNNKPFIIEINTIPGLSEESIIPKQLKSANIRLSEVFDLCLNNIN